MTILDEIVAYKRGFVEGAQAARPLEEVAEAAEAAPPARGFAAAIRGTRGSNSLREPQSTLRVIAEIKRASPSKGVIREDFRPAELAASYQRGGAKALSVLTDEKYFQGSLAALEAARGASTLPILRKEFMIDPYQVFEARAAGADCILLIAGMIPWDELRELRRAAAELAMDVLVEIHSEEEIGPALELRPDLIGINNRDLRDAALATDISRTEQLIGRIPAGVTLVSESGIRSREDVERLARIGVDGILVGEHLMREPDPGAAIQATLGIGRAPGPAFAGRRP